MDPVKVKIEESWKKVLWNEFQEDYFDNISQFLRKSKQGNKEVYPPGNLIFNAFEQTPFEDVKVVILGQDPYHNPGEAMGLSFSVPKHKRIPPSLLNIYKEINQDIGCGIPPHGDLSKWAHQGVFLLNAILTVEHKQAASHRKIGWQSFTDAVIKELSNKKENLIFLLWGNFARSKKEIIDPRKHLVLESAHPSPLARNAFFGHQHFSKTNDYLERFGLGKIDWQIT